jgi:hypothetical protein
MTEADWLHSEDPERLLKLAVRKASIRQLRLFACACARLLVDRCTAPGVNAIEAAEACADNSSARPAMLSAGRKLPWTNNMDPDQTARCTALADPCVAVRTTLSSSGRKGVKRRPRCALIRDIVGNPFQPVDFDAEWRTLTVQRLAKAAYEDRLLPSGQLDSDRLAILADALEDVGCDAPTLLSHLRGAGPHVRGCWAVDLVLANE